MSERIEVTTYFLQMSAPSAQEHSAMPPGVQVVRAMEIGAEEYRRLYLDVGAPWLWYERADLEPEELEALVHEEGVEIFLLLHDGICAGYSEIRFGTGEDDQAEAQILYFGLKPAFIGRGLGRFFLEWTVHRGFSKEACRLWVHTCSLDHARALATYESVGFREFRREHGWVRIPEHALARQRAALANSSCD